MLKVSDFSSARLGPAIEASAYLAAIIVEAGGQAGKRGADRVTLKRVRNRFLYFRGGRVGNDGQTSQLKSIDADVVLFDEWDEMDPRVPVIGATASSPRSGPFRRRPMPAGASTPNGWRPTSESGTFAAMSAVSDSR